MIFEIVCAADYMEVPRLFDVSCRVASTLDPVNCTTPAALRVRNISQLEEVISLERRYRVLAGKLSNYAWGELDSLKASGVIKADLSIRLARIARWTTRGTVPLGESMGGGS